MKRLMILALFATLYTSACGDDGSGAPPAEPYACTCPDAGGMCEIRGERVSSQDALCDGIADGETTSGAPDHTGCPNTCQCICYEEQCYLGSCTAIGGCATCPEFR